MRCLRVLAVLAVAGAGSCGGDDPSPMVGEGHAGTTTTAESTSTTGTTDSTTTTTTTTTAELEVPTVTASPSRGSTVTGEPDPGAPLPAFASSVSTVTAADLYASWRPGCPIPLDQLRAVDVSHWGFDGRIHTGRLIVAANQAQPIVAVMAELYGQRFPIERMQPIDVYGGDDNRSMSANNTSAFNCRAVTGGSGWSEHAYGRAIDVNPLVNPYVKGGTVLPPEAAPYADRSRRDAGMIHAADPVVQSFLVRGWKWGGYWTSLKDYQHFSTSPVHRT